MPVAVTGPLTGGQTVAHFPLHFEVVDVSGEKEYSVKPLALVSTIALPILAVFTLTAPAAGSLPPEEAAEGVPDELQAARATAAAADAARTRIFRVIMTSLQLGGVWY